MSEPHQGPLHVAQECGEKQVRAQSFESYLVHYHLLAQHYYHASSPKLLQSRVLFALGFDPSSLATFGQPS